jgi:hypothetical protein
MPGIAGRALRTVFAAAVAATLIGHAVLAAPSTTHPRLWLTTGDLARLRGWTVGSNPIWQSGLRVAAAAGLATANAHWNWTTGKPDSGWQDAGSSSYEGDPTEAYAEMFAFMSLIDPVTANRAGWAMRAHTMFMWAINQAYWAVEHGDDTTDTHPFAWAGMATYNRASSWGEAWGLTVDWIYPSFSAAEKATIRKVFLNWGQQILNASTTGEEHPQPIGVLDDLKLIGSSAAQSAIQRQEAQMQLRFAANNYFLAHMRNLALLSLAFDPANDPGPATPVGANLQSLVQDTIGAWLYQAYAVFGQAATVRAKLGVAGANHTIGLAAGGLPVEGTLYGESLGYLFQTLLALNTAGYEDTATYGPQVGFINDAYWNQAIDGGLAEITPRPFVPATEKYLGEVYGQANYGDVLRYFVYDNMGIWGPLSVYDRVNNPARYLKDLWLVDNVNEGGPAALLSRVSNIWGNADASDAIFYFMGHDPSVAAPADPRPTLPTAFIQPGIGRILAHSNWSASASWFTFRCSWEWINHEGGDCGEFEFFRKGTWLTKEWSGYADDVHGYSPPLHNVLSIQNTAPSNAGPDYLWEFAVLYGGQWNNGGSLGDPSVWLSVNANRAYAQVDATNLYNHPEYWIAAEAATDVKLARRSVVWLNPDHVIVYDRAQTGHAGRFKYQNLVLLAKPTIKGNTATLVANGQQLTVQVLQPATAALAEQHYSTATTPEFTIIAELDPARDRLVIADSAMPASTRFLTVLQGTDQGVAADKATRVASSSGFPFEGAVVADTVVLFPTTTATVTAFSYTVPASVTRHLITGLAPNAGYQVVFGAAAGVTTVAVAPGGSHFADVGGVLDLGFAASASATQGGAFPGFTLMQPE